MTIICPVCTKSEPIDPDDEVRYEFCGECAQEFDSGLDDLFPSTDEILRETLEGHPLFT